MSNENHQKALLDFGQELLKASNELQVIKTQHYQLLQSRSKLLENPLITIIQSVVDINNLEGDLKNQAVIHIESCGFITPDLNHNDSYEISFRYKYENGVICGMRGNHMISFRVEYGRVLNPETKLYDPTLIRIFINTDFKMSVIEFTKKDFDAFMSAFIQSTQKLERYTIQHKIETLKQERYALEHKIQEMQ